MSAALPYCAAQRVLTEQGTSVGTGWAESHHGSVCWHCPSCVVHTDTPSPLPCCLQATKVSITPGGKLRTQLQTLTTYKHPYQLHIHTHHTITMYIHTNTHAYHTITMYTLTHTLLTNTLTNYTHSTIIFKHTHWQTQTSPHIHVYYTHTPHTNKHSRQRRQMVHLTHPRSQRECHQKAHTVTSTSAGWKAWQGLETAGYPRNCWSAACGRSAVNPAALHFPHNHGNSLQFSGHTT